MINILNFRDKKIFKTFSKSSIQQDLVNQIDDNEISCDISFLSDFNNKSIKSNNLTKFNDEIENNLNKTINNESNIQLSQSNNGKSF